VEAARVAVYKRDGTYDGFKNDPVVRAAVQKAYEPFRPKFQQAVADTAVEVLNALPAYRPSSASVKQSIVASPAVADVDDFVNAMTMASRASFVPAGGVARDDMILVMKDYVGASVRRSTAAADAVSQSNRRSQEVVAQKLGSGNLKAALQGIAGALAGAGIAYLASDGSCTAFDGRCGGCRSFYGALYSTNSDLTRKGPIMKLDGSSCAGGAVCSSW
jgi:hypothetical protein